MITIKEIQITKASDYDKLFSTDFNMLIDNELITTETIDILKANIGTKATRILVEYPYYDSEYLSNYYSHYSQKFKHYSKMCCRIHFEKNQDYLGYITLRPTPGNTKIGKTFLTPAQFVNDTAYLIKTPFTAHFLGQKREIDCFPWKKQEVDISCCAHTATWTVLKYFGTKYKNYSDTSIGEIVSKIKNNWGRKTPTMGLDPTQVSDIFKEYGFSPIIIGKKKIGLPIDELLSYIESGLPIVLFLKMFPENHSISIIGHGLVDTDMINDSLVDKESGVILSSKLIKSVYAMDDRLFPYVEVPKGLPSSDSDVNYGLHQLDYAVIPLHPRMQLSYSEVYHKMTAWVKDPYFNYGKNPICRIYITTSIALKEHAFSNDTMDEEVKNIFLSLSMPRFVWCIDFADVESYKNHMTTGRIIVDSTSATLEDDPWIIRHDSNTIQFKDYDKNCEASELEIKIAPYRMYTHNLNMIEGKEI
jgi:hypothetical protein